jgi:hypothetical protein
VSVSIHDSIHDLKCRLPADDIDQPNDGEASHMPPGTLETIRYIHISNLGQ